MSIIYNTVAEKMRSTAESFNEQENSKTDVSDILVAIESRSKEGKTYLQVSGWNHDKMCRIAQVLEANGFSITMSRSQFGMITRYIVKVSW